MRKIILDVENTTTQLDEKRRDYSPYNKNNKLVSIQWLIEDDGICGNIHNLFLYHTQMTKPVDLALYEQLKHDLASAQVIVGHNLKHDLSWLIAAGLSIDHLHVNDTMIMEYVMARGRTNEVSFSLAECCRRYDVNAKGDIFDRYPDLQISEMPIDEVEEYGVNDIKSTYELYIKQSQRLTRQDYRSLIPTLKMMHEFCIVLTHMQRHGVKVSFDALSEVEHEYTEESNQLQFVLQQEIRKYMGDTPVNLDSTQQLSEVVYSLKLNEKAQKTDEADRMPKKRSVWETTFNIGKNERNKLLKRPYFKPHEFSAAVSSMTESVLKTKMVKCEACNGKGKIRKTKKDGTPWAKENNCKACEGRGCNYVAINELAGLGMRPANVNYTTTSGFSTGKTFLTELIDQANEDKKPDAADFLEKLMRLSAISTYLSSFVGGIKTFTQMDTGLLHPNFNQTITSTGRLSSTEPNLQNQPREQTFPIRKVFISRWVDSGGEIGEVDFSQLEFRCAVSLAEDENGKRDILGGMDIHKQTAKVITDAGQFTDRQGAKKHTFKPLYGGKSGTQAERTYYDSFLTELYPEIGDWHKALQEEAIANKSIMLPTGRQYLFPDVKRNYYGGVTGATQIVNFPVQGFATGDIVPIAIIRLFKEFKLAGLQSLIVLTVHDSVAVDIYPGEKEKVLTLLKKLAIFAEEELKIRYGIEMFVPLDCEVKCGDNLMEMKKVA